MAATLNREEAELDQAINQLQDTVRADIAEFARSSPSDETGRKLQSKIQRNTTHLRARLRELELLAEEQETIEEGDAVVAVVTQHKRSYEELQRALRNANLEVQRRAAQAAQEQRKALMGSGDYMQRAQQLKTQQDLTNSAADTTASLQRTRQLMAEELQHTSATLAAMETSETTLKAANKQYKDQRGTIKQSQGLLRTMRVNSLKDSLKLYTALAFFTLVMAYIGFRRMSYFVPPAIINSLPSLKTFGLGQTQANSGAEMPYLDQQQYEVPGIDSGGGEGHSTASPSSFQTRLAEVQRHAGVALRQAAHHSRRLAVWLFQQSRTLIAGIKQKIEERQGKKLGQKDLSEGSSDEGSGEAWPDPSDPAYEEPPAVYEDPGQPQQQQAGQAEATGAHPGYAGGLEAMYGGGSMRGSGESLGANDTMPDSSEGGDPAVNQTAAHDAASTEQFQRPDQEIAAMDTYQQATQDPEVLDGAAAHEQQNISVTGEGDMGVRHEAKNNTQRLEEAELITGISPDAEPENASTPVAGTVSSDDSDPPSAVSAAEALPSADSGDKADEPFAAEGDPLLDSTIAEDVSPGVDSAGVDREPLPLGQEEPLQQENEPGIADSALSDISEAEVVYLPRQGTMPEPPEEVEDSTVTPAADTPLQEDQQAEKGIEGSMQLDPPIVEEDGSASRDAAAAPSRERVPLIGKVLGKMRWPEEGPSRPRGGTEEVQRTGGVGSSERGATGSGKAGSVTGQASGGDRVSDTIDSPAVPEAEVPVSEVLKDSDGESRNSMTEATDSLALSEEAEELVPGALDDDGPESIASGNIDLIGEDDEAATSEQMPVPSSHKEPDDSASEVHMKDEL